MSLINQMLEACEQQVEFDIANSGPSTPRRPTFSKWEQGFIKSVREQFDERGFVTNKQEEILRRLWDKGHFFII